MVVESESRPDSREIPNDGEYVTDGELQRVATRQHIPNVPKVSPISRLGNVNGIIGKFGGAGQLQNAVNQLQSLLHAAWMTMSKLA